MKNNSLIYCMLLVLLTSIVLFSCDDDDNNNDNNQNKEKLINIESPYLICANRNPGGVGFDFEYKGKKGAANNLDSLSVSDFEYDVKIRTIKGERPDGSQGGAPFIQLYNTVKAVNYSKVDTTCKGIIKFKELTTKNVLAYTLKSDGQDFNTESVAKGETGAPLMKDLLAEYKKLVIGIKWKEAAKNNVAKDEPIWIIETREGKLVKFIVTDFPANPAPTQRGYVAIQWDFL